MPSLLDRLKQRKLVQWALAYLAGAWLILQLVDVLGERWGISLGMGRVIDVALIVGFFATLVLAWYHGEQGKQRVSGTELLILAGVLGVGAVVLSAVDLGGPTGQANQPTPLSAIERDKPAIAVLPFDNISPDPNDAYFADGMHEQIISQLANVSGLAVISRTSVLAYVANRKNVTEIATELGVDFVLEGSARRDRDRVRLTAQLINGQTDEHLWAEDYDRDLTVTGLFDIQDDLATRIASSLSATILPEESAEIAGRPTESLRAYEHYLRARAVAPGNGSFNALQSDSAAAHLEQALALDPGFVEARGWLAYHRAVAADWNNTPDRVAAAKEAVEAAFLAAPDLPQARLARAFYVLWFLHDREPVDTLLAPLIIDTPRDGTSAGLVARIQATMGSLQQAIRTLEEAESRDPLNAENAYILSHLYLVTRRFDEAKAAAQRMRLLAPARQFEATSTLALAELLQTGNVQRVREIVAPWPADWAPLAATNPVAPTIPLIRALPIEERRASWAATVEFYADPAIDALEVIEIRRAYGRGMVHVLRDQDGMAAVEFGSALALATAAPRGKHYWGWLAILNWRLGNKSAAIETVRTASVESAWDGLYGQVYRILEAQIFANFNEPDAAVDALQELLPPPSWISVPLLQADPIYDPLRDHLRFQALLERYSQPN